MATSIDKEFKGQVNTAWGLTIQTTNKVPEVAKRIFKTKSAAEAYIKDINDTAIEGLILTVVEDGTNNGAYFVKSIKTSENENGGELVKLSDINTSLFTIVSSLPTASKDTLNKIYLIEDASNVSGNKYIEYICVETVSGENITYAWEKLGEYKATIELGDYYKKTETYSSVEVDNKINIAKDSIPTNISDFANDDGYIESDNVNKEIKFKHYNLEGDDERTNVIDLSFTGITLEYNQRNTANEEDYFINALIIDNEGAKIKKEYYNNSGGDSYESLIATEAYVDNAIAGGISNNYLLKESNEPQTISVTIIDEFNEGCYDRSLLSINGTGLTCAFSKVNTPGNDPVEGSIEITNSKDYIDIKPDKDINLLQHSLTINHKAVSLDGHNHDDLYYTETEVNNLLKDKLDATTDGGISVNEIVHLGGVFDEETKDSLILRHGEGDERRIKLTSTGINFEVNYEYTDENEDQQSVATIVTINDTLRVGGTPVSLEGHTHNGLEKIAQLEATIATMQQTIVSLQQQIESLTTGQGIVTPENIGQFAVTSITGENSDISATERDNNGNVVISLNSITNIAFGDATEIEEENTAQF